MRYRFACHSCTFDRVELRRHRLLHRTARLGALVGLLAVTGLCWCTLDFPEEWLTQNCGNGVLDEGEECDDGDTFAGNGCSDTCTVERGYYCDGEPSDCTTQCGDGIQAGAEECDDGNLDPGDGCSPACRTETGDCGDGNIDANEGCDDANTTGGDGCSATCQVESGFDCVGVPSQCSPICGDGVRVASEACDDGNLTAGDGCGPLCQVEHGFYCTGTPSVCVTQCGDALVASTEGCDDGQDPPTGGDGCDAACQVEAGWSCSGEPSACSPDCGDGLINGVETCDDSNIADGDGCDAACQVEAGWSCSGEPSTCETTCGDGVVVAGMEECDDGQSPPAAGDGCDDQCRVEAGWSCDNTSPPSVCTETCGDGIRVGAEAEATGCDDGNTAPGDGCSAACQVEPHYTCSGEPSACELICEVPEATWTQSGCPGQNCAVTLTLDIGCVPAGSTAAYGACTAQSDCTAGTLCIQDRHTTNSCLPFCDPNASPDPCGPGQLCWWTVSSNQGDVGLCEQEDACNPSWGASPSGCAAGQGCYLIQQSTWCETQGSVALGGSCSSYVDCVPGASCLNFGNPGDPACYEMCDTAAGAWTCQTASYQCYGLVGVTRWGACLP